MSHRFPSLSIVGLFGAYLAYRYGKRRAARRAEKLNSSIDEFEVCDLCGFERRFHADDEIDSEDVDDVESDYGFDDGGESESDY